VAVIMVVVKVEEESLLIGELTLIGLLKKVCVQ
jgi:hypothetical protein